MDNDTKRMIIIFVIGIAIVIIAAFRKRKEEIKEAQKYRSIPETMPEILGESIKNTKTLPYKKRPLLTKNEWNFYKGLKPAADELGYSILAKIRVADLVEVTAKDRSEWQTYFNKVNKKHIDFALAKPENLEVELLIELDDSTHDELQKERDQFINELYSQTEYKLLRVRNNKNIKEKIENILCLANSQEINKQFYKPPEITLSETQARARDTTEETPKNEVSNNQEHEQEIAENIIVSEVEIIMND